MKILIIEDEPDMLDNLRQSMESEHYVVEVAETYEAAMLKIAVYEYDCILLDITLPGGNGLDVLEELKRSGKSEGVIIVSAKNSLDDKLKGLGLGADDYLAKPFYMAELHARLKSVLRRKKFKGTMLIHAGNVVVDPEERSVRIHGVEVPLNRKEFDVLLYFAMNINRLINKTSLAEHVWGDHIDQADDFEFIYSQIKNLRKKLKDHQATIEIQAVYGIGYKLVQR